MAFISWMFGVTNMLDPFCAFWDMSVWFIPTGELRTAILWTFLPYDVPAKSFVEILEKPVNDVCASIFVTDDGNAWLDVKVYSVEPLILDVDDDEIVSIALLDSAEFEFGIAVKLDVIPEEGFSKGELCTTLSKCEVIVEELERLLLLFSFK